MPIALEKAKFDGMGEVYDLMKERGLWPVMVVHDQMVPEEVHWHDRSNQIFIVEGNPCFFDGESEEWHQAEPGDIAVVPKRTLHAAKADERVVLIAGFNEAISLKEFVPHLPEEL